jgi:methionine sulfoxide reductase heme-binding subunit
MSVEWLVIRGSGVAAFALLTAATIWGLLVSTKLVGRLVKAKPLTWFHESLGVGALVATVIHVVVLSMHDYLEFTWPEILVPGLSDWRSSAVAMGIAAFYGLLLVSLSFYLKHRIGQKRWRAIHYASFGVFVSALIHGVWSGSDSRSPIMLGVYLGGLTVVFGLIGYRFTATFAARETPGRVT